MLNMAFTIFLGAGALIFIVAIIALINAFK